MIKGKKGWIRILESFIAIILIAGVLLVLYTRSSDNSDESEAIYQMEKAILDEIASTQELRDDILDNQTANIEIFVSDRLPPEYSFEVKICKVDYICELSEYRRAVYSNERVISSNVTKYEPKKIKLFIWEEE